MTPASLSIEHRAELAHVQHCAQTAADAFAERDRAIRLARKSGLSLRAVAEAAGMTAMGIRGICEREPSNG